MYNEKREGFSVRDILIQIIFVTLFVFIMIWLFPTKSNVIEQNDKLDILTSNIFSDNIYAMRDAAVNYYTINRLPKNLNDKEKITLGEMLNKKLLVEFVDGNGNKCDIDSSYVEVVKLKDEYQMKINLSCTDNDAYIIVHLGCYDYCNGLGICVKDEEVVITQNKPVVCKYEYEKVTSDKWGEYGSWSNWSADAVSKTDYRLVQTKVSEVQTGTKRVKTGTEVKTATPECPEGYNLSNGTCYGNGTELETATPECPTGYKLKGSKCTMTTPVEYTKGSYIGTYTADALPTSTSKYYYETVSADYVYDCADECAMKWVTTYKKYNTVVTGGVTDETPAYCKRGTLNEKDGLCHITIGRVVTARPECPSGYDLDGSVCTKTVPTYTDEAIYSDVTYYRYKERNYISGNRVTEWSTSQNDANLLNQKYTLTGNKNCA